MNVRMRWGFFIFPFCPSFVFICGFGRSPEDPDSSQGRCFMRKTASHIAEKLGQMVVFACDKYVPYLFLCLGVAARLSTPNWTVVTQRKTSWLGAKPGILFAALLPRSDRPLHHSMADPNLSPRLCRRWHLCPEPACLFCERCGFSKSIRVDRQVELPRRRSPHSRARVLTTARGGRAVRCVTQAVPCPASICRQAGGFSPQTLSELSR